MCLLHTNELPLRHVFGALDGSTSGPDTFVGPIGKILHGPVSRCTITQFKPLSISGGSRGEDVGDAPPPSANFNNVFDE